MSIFFLWAGRLIVLAMIMVAPWCFGSVSQIYQSWLMRLAVAGLTMWWFSMAFGNRTTQLFPYLAFPVILGLLLVGLQMLPLSQELSRVVAPKQAELYQNFALPIEGELLATVQPAVVSPRITMDIDGTAKMFNLLLLALISLILGCHFFGSRRVIFLLPFVMTVNGVAIAAYGMVQRLGSITTIYGFEIDNVVQPFGPFINKNNAAGYLLICFAGSLMLLYGAFHRRGMAGQRPKPIITNDYPILRRLSLHASFFLAELTTAKLAAILATVTIAAGILFTFSRGGILAFGVGFATTTTYYCLTRKSSFVVLGLFGSALLFVGLLGFLGVGDQLASRLDTLSDVDLMTTDKRVNHWIQTAPAIGEFSPLGSGVGSYVNVHRLYRTDSEKRVFFFAENQYFQTLVEAGMPGLFLLLSAIVLLGLSIRFIGLRGNSPKTTATCIMGTFLLPSQVIAAIFDFGLFIPANTILMATACGFIAGQSHALADRLKKKYVFRFNLPRFITLVMLLVVFTVSLFSMLSCERYARVERAMGKNPQNENYVSMDLPTTDRHIADLKTAIEKTPDANGLIRLSELYLYRYRIRLFHALVGEDVSQDAVDSEALDRNWLSTGVDRLHNMVYQAWGTGSQRQVNALITDPLVNDNILPAVYFLKISRSRSPLKPSVHLLLAQLHAVSPTKDADLGHLQRSMQLAPANSITALICGILNLQANRTDAARKNLKTCLQIDASNYNRVIRVAVPFLLPEQIARDILPDDPHMLYLFAKTYMASKSAESLKLDVYQRVEDLLDEGQQWDRKSLVRKAEVQLELGHLQGAIETLGILVSLNPGVTRFNIQLAQLLVDNGELDKALEIAQYLVKHHRSDKTFKLYKRIKKLQENSSPPR